MEDFKLNGKYYEVKLASTGKIVKIEKDWVDKTVKTLQTDVEDVLLMYLEDNEILVNEEQEELNKKAIAKENRVKPKARADVPKKTQKERTQKENPTKELIIAEILEKLKEIEGISNVIVENKAKIITFSLNNEDFKVDLIQKRKK